MSEEDNKEIETTNTTVADEFARQFANFMRNSFAQNQTPKNPPETTPTHRIDTQPLLIGFKLNGDNYPQWSVLMETSISGRGMVSHLTGVPPSPPRTDPSFPQWQQADHCVFTWLVQNLEPRLVNRVLQQPMAKHIWDSLAVTYASGSDGIQVFDLHRKANAMKQGNTTLDDVWTALQEIWLLLDQRQPNRMKYPEDIEIRNQEVQELRLYQFLAAIDDIYESMKKEILKMQPLPSPDVAYGLVRREETRTLVLRPGSMDNGPPPDGVGAGLAARGRQNQSTGSRGGGRSGGGWNRRSEGHRSDEDKLKLICSNCGRRKHTKESCFELVGFPDWWEEKHGKPPPLPCTPWNQGGRAAVAIGDDLNQGQQLATTTVEGNREAATV